MTFSCHVSCSLKIWEAYPSSRVLYSLPQPLKHPVLQQHIRTIISLPYGCLSFLLQREWVPWGLRHVSKAPTRVSGAGLESKEEQSWNKMNVRILTSTSKACLAFTEKASVPPNCVLSTEHNSLMCSCDFTYITPSSFFLFFVFVSLLLMVVVMGFFFNSLFVCLPLIHRLVKTRYSHQTPYFCIGPERPKLCR